VAGEQKMENQHREKTRGAAEPTPWEPCKLWGQVLSFSSQQRELLGYQRGYLVKHVLREEKP
jgi:hypothetical protein